MDRQRMRVVVLVKAAPVLTSQLEETMCVAGIRTDGAGGWVRLHPVPFRDLGDDEKFKKYQVVSADVIRPKSGDRRPESWTPVQGTIALHEQLSTKNSWARRRQLIDDVAAANTCDLIDMNGAGSGAGIPSLAVVRPAAPPKLLIDARAEEQLEEWRRRAVGAAGLTSLFDDPAQQRPEFEIVPWRFRYHYRCRRPSCSGHKQTIVDWEIVALWRRVRNRDDWKEQMRLKFEDELWSGRDSALFVGNMEQRPWNFLVLGVFWPPAGPVQRVLDL